MFVVEYWLGVRIYGGRRCLASFLWLRRVSARTGHCDYLRLLQSVMVDENVIDVTRDSAGLIR